VHQGFSSLELLDPCFSVKYAAVLSKIHQNVTNCNLRTLLNGWKCAILKSEILAGTLRASDPDALLICGCFTHAIGAESMESFS
jgi:hypothetical protein